MKQDHDSSVFDARAKDTGQPSVAGFTPGPWSLCAHLTTPPTDCSCGYRGGIWSEPADQIICEMGPHGQGWQMIPQPDMETHRANARLIAAAPDLYEALLAQDNAVEEHSKCECRHRPEAQLTRMCSKCTFRYLRASQLRQAALAKAVPHTVDRTPGDTSNTDPYPNTTTAPTGESDG